MGTKRLILILVVCLLLSVVACGGQKEPIIETPAGEMNFSAADLGPNWSLQQEQGLNEILKEVPKHVLDANMRVFLSMEPFGVITSLTYSTKSVSSARKEMKGMLVKDTIASLQEQVAGGTFKESEAPGIGDEAFMVGGKGSFSGMDVSAYVLVFRKANVIGMVFVVGPGEVATEESVMGYARKLEAKIQ